MLMMSYSDHFLSVVHPLTISNDFSSEVTEPILLKFHMDPARLGNERLLNGCSPLTKMAAKPVYGKNF